MLIVSHDGARWLPAVIDGVRSQTATPGRVVAVDTGSKDESANLLEAAFEDVVRAPSSTHFPAAVQLGLDRLGRVGHLDAGFEWVWILHDDANPEPGALAALLEAASADPDADVLGPKLREWPSLRRLLELGVTISGTGRRETGLERGEYDQGHHDEVRPVLAVNTAGMLVRRSVLEELGGFDAQLPIFGNDIDFGWRAAAAGHRTIVVPQAVVFHAEAAHRGARRTPLTGRHTHYQERRAALYTLLVNSSGRSLPFQLVRLALGSLLRMVGFLLVRSVGEALDELAALLSLYSSPREIRAARRARRETREGGPGGAPAPDELRARVRPLLAPPWLPYRHGLDLVGDLVSAATDQASDVAERRRVAAAERDPSSFAARRPVADDDDAPLDDSGWVARFVTNPVLLLLAVFVVASVIGAREAFGSVVGGGLSPAPGSASDWWGLHLESWHALGQGTAVPAPPYVLPLAVLATLLGGPTHALTAILVLAVPAALGGAFRFLRVVGRLVSFTGAPRWLLLWGAATYALVPVVSGAWGDGRLGPVVTTALLPWLAHAALGFADPAPERRWRAAWRAGLLLALVAAFAPVAWLFAVVLGLVVLVVAFSIVPGAVRDRTVWGPPAAAVAVPVGLLAPWWLPALVHSASAGLLLEPGRLPEPGFAGLDLLAGRFADLGAPGWLGVLPAALAIVALVPRATRIPVLVCWVVALVTVVLAAVLGPVSLSLAATTTSPGLGFLLVALQGAFVVAAVVGGQGLLAVVRARASWVQATALGLAAVAVLAPLGGLVWFVVGGHDEALGDEPEDVIPAYMVQSSQLGPAHGILVVRGSVDDGLTYTVRRGDGVTLGEDEVIALSQPDADLTRAVRSLTAHPSPQAVDALAGLGIEYVVLAAPADGAVSSVLDATAGLTQASAEDRSTRAWQVGRPLDAHAVDGPRSWLRIGLLVLQGVGLLVVAVLCAPTTNRRRAS